VSSVRVRSFNATGIELFRAALADLRDGARADLPEELLADVSNSHELDDVVDVDWMSFATRLEVARHLHERLAKLAQARVDRDRGMWSWLSAYYFDVVAPKRGDGLRRPGRDYRHLFDTGYRFQNRHLLFGAYQLYRRHGEACALLLLTPPHVESALYHEIASRLDLIANRGVLEAVEALYFDRAKGGPKRGAQDGKTGAGTIRRLVHVLQQLDLTFDIYGMSGEQIVELLPPEFDAWRHRPLFSA